MTGNPPAHGSGVAGRAETRVGRTTVHAGLLSEAIAGTCDRRPLGPSPLPVSDRHHFAEWWWECGPDGSKLDVTAARHGPVCRPVIRLAEIAVTDGQLPRIACERH